MNDGARPRRIYITGGPGSGKTRLAGRLGALTGWPVHDLDGMALAISGLQPPLDRLPELTALREAQIKELARGEAWISEGSFVGSEHDFLRGCQLIVWLDASWRVAAYRILLRHVKASLARNNRFPGLWRLYRFWRWSARYYSDRNPWGLNIYGTPATNAYLAEVLSKYPDKVTRCVTKADVERLLALVSG